MLTVHVPASTQGQAQDSRPKTQGQSKPNPASVGSVSAAARTVVIHRNTQRHTLGSLASSLRTRYGP